MRSPLLIKIIFYVITLVSIEVNAAVGFPKNLSKSDRRKVTEALGPSTSMKVLGNPFPLGGYSGFEVGYAYEVVSTKEISTLGNRSTVESETNYSLLTIGKGLYNNFDIVIQFSPFTQAEDISNFGGQIRWGFFQARNLPLHMSLMSSFNSVNFQDQVLMTSQGNDLVAGFSVQDITLYTGVGVVRTISTFMGRENCTDIAPVTCAKDNDSITDSGKTVKEDLSESHYLAGVNIKMENLFFAMQMDRYAQSVFSAKLGYRF